MTPLPSISTLFPYTTLFRSYYCQLEDGLYNNELLQEVMHLEDSLGKERGNFGRLIQEANTLKDTVKAKEYADKLDRKSTRLNSSHVRISYAVFCLKKKRWSA